MGLRSRDPVKGCVGCPLGRSGDGSSGGPVGGSVWGLSGSLVGGQTTRQAGACAGSLAAWVRAVASVGRRALIDAQGGPKCIKTAFEI